MKKLLNLLLLLMIMPFFTWAQMPGDMVHWNYSAKKISENTYDVSAKASMHKGWHIYTQNPGGDGSQIPTEVNFKKNPDLQLVGKLKAVGKPTSENVDAVGIIHYYLNTVTFKQTVKVNKSTVLKGVVSYQTCDSVMCLPPADENFSIKLDGTEANAVGTTEEPASGETALTDNGSDSGTEAVAGLAGNNLNNNSPGNGAPNQPSISQDNSASVGSGLTQSSSLWKIFLTGLIAGLAAFITPCIYAMLPITVSFFTKRSKDKATGLKNATFYSFSIIGIFLVVGILISTLFSETTMYNISSSVWFNLFVFTIFVLFGISLLGAFEITLPASWSSKLDTKANTTNFGGIFFMALVLVIVSFSCTSAFISFLIVEIVQAHNRLGGLIGFLGFGMSIALPFAFFAYFPGLLNNIAKSGGWLNAVKVTMGFIELALAMKFLSNVDLQYHWHLLDYNVYLSIWIILFGLLGIYLLGRIRFSHDDDLPKNMFGQPHLSTTRLLFAVAALSFSLYMVPGMFGAPLLGISGWLPEKKTLNANFYDMMAEIQAKQGMMNDNGGATLVNNNKGVAPLKYTDFLKSELPAVTTYFDMNEAMAASKALNKPILIDFTGHSCVNCRKMEAAVLSKPEVSAKLNKDFILVSLYTDERHPLPQNEHYQSKSGRMITTVGDRNLDMEVNKFGEVAQPMYIFVDGQGNLIYNAGGYVPDVDRFMNIMTDVQNKYKNMNAGGSLAATQE